MNKHLKKLKHYSAEIHRYDANDMDGEEIFPSWNARVYVRGKNEIVDVSLPKDEGDYSFNCKWDGEENFRGTDKTPWDGDHGHEAILIFRKINGWYKGEWIEFWSDRSNENFDIKFHLN